MHFFMSPCRKWITGHGNAKPMVVSILDCVSVRMYSFDGHEDSLLVAWVVKGPET